MTDRRTHRCIEKKVENRNLRQIRLLTYDGIEQSPSRVKAESIEVEKSQYEQLEGLA